jgi:hypothetical protein
MLQGCTAAAARVNSSAQGLLLTKHRDGTNDSNRYQGQAILSGLNYNPGAVGFTLLPNLSDACDVHIAGDHMHQPYPKDEQHIAVGE